MIYCLILWWAYLLGIEFMVKMENVVNTFFNIQKKEKRKRKRKRNLLHSRWQEFFVKYGFMWKHRPGKQHCFWCLKLTRCGWEISHPILGGNIYVQDDKDYRCCLIWQRLLKFSTAGEIWSAVEGLVGGWVTLFWIIWLYVLAGKGRLLLLRKTHNPLWIGRPGRERMQALLSHNYYWLGLEKIIETYIKTCLVLDKTSRRN